jgi:hypothetical protein
MTEADWTPEEDEAFNEVEKSSNLGKQILQDIEGQPYVYPPKREWVGLTDEDKQEWIAAAPAGMLPLYLLNLIEEIEAELKEKNDRTL